MRPAAFTILILGACSSQPEAAPPADNVAPTVETATNQPDTPAEPVPPFAEVEGAHPTTPEPAPIPARFRGTWAEQEADCGAFEKLSRLTISGRTIRSPSYVLFGESFTVPAPGQFALEGKYEGSGNVGAAHYSIDAAGDILTDEAGGGMVRMRCP